MPGKVLLFIGFLIGLFDGMVFVGCGYVQVVGKLQIYNIKRRLSRGGGNMADLGAGFDETWCKI